MLRTHYRQPIDFTIAGLKESWKMLERWYEVTEPLVDPAPDAASSSAGDDLKHPRCHCLAASGGRAGAGRRAGLLGFSNMQMKIANRAEVDTVAIADAIAARNAARKAKDFKESTASATICWPRVCVEGWAAGHELGGQAMSKERLFIFDTTLRDGAQTQGGRFLGRGQAPDRAGAGWSGCGLHRGRLAWCNPTDTAFFAERPKLAAPASPPSA